MRQPTNIRHPADGLLHGLCHHLNAGALRRGVRALCELFAAGCWAACMGGEVGRAGGERANARVADLADLGIVTMGRECAREGLIRDGYMGAVHSV